MYMYSANHNQRHYIIRWMIFKSNTSKDKFKSCFGEYNRFEYWVLRSYVSNVMMSKLLKADNWVSRQKRSNIENPAKLVSVTVKDGHLMSLIIEISSFSASRHLTGLQPSVCLVTRGAKNPTAVGNNFAPD